MGALMSRRVLPILLQGLVLWPVWRWYVAGVGDPSGEPWGLLALVAAGFVLSRSRGEGSPAGMALPAALLLLYAVTFRYLTPLPRAVIGVTALSSSLCLWRLGRPLHVGVWGLAMLSLPVIPTLQFYFGYPLRVVVGALAAGLLRLGGLAVEREGVGLSWAGQTVLVDAPCSGIRMLWSGLLLCLTLACLHRLSAARTLIAAALAVGAIVAGNALRAASLFYLEAGLLPLPGETHEWAGVVVFAGTAAAIVGIVSRLPGPDVSSRAVSVAPAPVRPAAQLPYLAACALALAAPLVPAPPHASDAEAAFPGWPTHFEGRPLLELPLTAREQRFARDFPGRLARFSDGRRELVIRWITDETRRLHPAADCFRGLGYRTEPGPAEIDGEGRTWGRYDASRGLERLRVLERIEDAGGRGFSDVSAWYWAALTGTSAGPWWAITIAERAEETVASSS